MLNVDQIVSSHKAQLTTLHDLTCKALDTIEKMSTLNLQASSASFAEHAAHGLSLLSTKDVKGLAELQSKSLQQLTEKATAYNRQLLEIAAGLGGEFNQLAQAQMADAQKQFVAAAEAAMKNVPKGAEPIVAAVKASLSNATSAMDSVNAAVKQAAETTQSSFAAMVNDSAIKTAKTTKSSKAAAD